MMNFGPPGLHMQKNIGGWGCRARNYTYAITYRTLSLPFLQDGVCNKLFASFQVHEFELKNSLISFTQLLHTCLRNTCMLTSSGVHLYISKHINICDHILLLCMCIFTCINKCKQMTRGRKLSNRSIIFSSRNPISIGPTWWSSEKFITSHPLSEHIFTF